MPSMEIYKRFTFDSAHWLPLVPAGHKCGRMHGHTYTLIVYCSGPLDSRGFILDYAELAATVKPILDQLDHHDLNMIEGLGNPTTEVLALWIWARLRPILPCLSRIEVQESSTTGCLYAE